MSSLRLGTRVLVREGKDGKMDDSLLKESRRRSTGMDGAAFRLGKRVTERLTLEEAGDTDARERKMAGRPAVGGEVEKTPAADNRMTVAVLEAGLGQAKADWVRKMATEEFASGEPRRGALKALLAAAKRTDAGGELIQRLEKSLEPNAG